MQDVTPASPNSCIVIPSRPKRARGLSRKMVAIVMVAIVIVVAEGLPPVAAGSSPDSVGPAQPVNGLFLVTASFAGWTWFGTGEPCELGGNLTFVAHFYGNASGGVPPYRFEWDFGDGSNNSTVRNATHIFLTLQDEWTVNLSASDSAGRTALDSIAVVPPAFSCPPQALPPPNPLPLFLILLAVPVLVTSAVLMVYRTRRRRKGAP